MAATPDPDLVEILYEAIRSPYGVVIQTSEFTAGVARLYRVRSQLGDPDLQQLQFRRSPHQPTTEIWAVKVGASIPPEALPPQPQST